MHHILVGHATTGTSAMNICADGQLRFRVIGQRDVIMFGLLNNLDGHIRPRHFKDYCNYYFITDFETVLLNNLEAFVEEEAGMSWGTKEGTDAVLTHHRL